MSIATGFVRRHRRRRRPRRLRGRARRRAHGLRDAAAEPEPRHDGADGLQPLGRRPRQGAAGARDRRARRRDGAAGGPRVHPRQGPQRLARGRRARHADAERPAGLPPRDEAPARGRSRGCTCARGASSACCSRGAPAAPACASPASRSPAACAFTPARSCSPTGTFLNGLIHIGDWRTAAGRAGEEAATALARQLRDLGFEVGRLKTGTPPRLRRSSIDFSRMEVAPRRRAPAPLLLRHRPGRVRARPDALAT